MNRGVCLLYKKDYNEAVVNFSHAFEIDPTNSNALVNLAIAKYTLGDKTDACEKIQAAVKMGNKTAGGYSMRMCRNEKGPSFQIALLFL
ncbi:MAG: tetratricopeptide repeat protein [Bacteroidota bacterium]